MAAQMKKAACEWGFANDRDEKGPAWSIARVGLKGKVVG